MRSPLIFFVLAMAAAAPVAYSSGAQIVLGPAEKLKTTRIRDGKWRRDIALGKGITVQDAALLVRSVRSRAISDNADAKSAKEWPAIDADKLTEINASEWIDIITSTPWSYVRQAGARYFDVIEYSGRINVVGLIDGRLKRVGSIVIDP
jgi:hypothetical protein